MEDYLMQITNFLLTQSWHIAVLAVVIAAVSLAVENIEDRIKTIMNPGKKFYKRASITTVITVVFLAALTVPTTLALTTWTEDKTDVLVEGGNAKAVGHDKSVASLISSSLEITKNSVSERRAFMKLVELGDSAVPALLNRLSSTKTYTPSTKSQNDMKTLIEILSEIGTEKALPFIDKANKEAKKQLSQSHLSPDRAKYLSDIWATHCKERIQIWNSSDKLEQLLAALDKPYLRKWAIYKLGVLCDKKALVPLQKILDGSDQLDSRESARDSIKHIESQRKMPLYYKYHRRSQTFKIKTDKQIFQLGEAIPLEYELIAGGYGSQTLLRFQEAKGYLLPFGVAGPERYPDWRGRYQLHVRMMKPHSLPAKQIKLRKKVIEEKAVERFQLAAGEHIKGKIDISEAYKLDQPGEYRVSIRIANYVSSDEITIQIRPTTQPPMDKNASLKLGFKPDVEVEGKGVAETELEKRVESAEKSKAGIREKPVNSDVYKQLDEIVELSELTAEMAFSEAIEVIRYSVEPPLKIVVLWRDLYENAEIERTTPINMDGISAVPLGVALKLLLKSVSGGFAELGYVVEDGVIIIATKESLPRKPETRTYDISDLTSKADDSGLESIFL